MDLKKDNESNKFKEYKVCNTSEIKERFEERTTFLIDSSPHSTSIHTYNQATDSCWG